MKNLKKVMALLMAATMATGLAACGGKSDGSEKDSNKPGTSGAGGSESQSTYDPYNNLEKDKDGKTVDLGGMEIIIRDWWTKLPAAEATSNYDKAKEDYLKFIQETYNFTITEVGISGWGDVITDFQNYVTADQLSDEYGGGDNGLEPSGKNEYFIFCLYTGSAFNAAMEADMMYDVKKLSAFDWSDSKWITSVSELTTNDKGQQFGFRGSFHEPRNGVYFNTRLLKEIAGVKSDEIYDLQAADNWTWDKYAEYCQKCMLDEDKNGDYEVYGMVCFTSRFYPAAVISNGTNFFGKDKDGKFYSRMEEQNTLDALNWAYDMIDKYNRPQKDGENWDYFTAAFTNGEAVFYQGEVYMAGQDLSEMEDDFGFVAFPKGPKGTYMDKAGDNVYVIPSNYKAEDVEKIAFAYNLYTNPIPKYENYEGWKTGYYNNFRDERSVDESLSYVAKNSVLEYHTLIPSVDLGPQLFWGINKETSPAAKIEESKPVWDAYIRIANGEQGVEVPGTESESE